MPIWDTHRAVRRLPVNIQGDDFIIGDLHGCYDQLFTLLNAVGFDPVNDRVISVGDLIDRGPDSLKCAELVYEPWFYAVLGNHEEMMIESMHLSSPSYIWLANGGTWYHDHDHTTIKDVMYSIATLPYVLVVGEGAERYNVVHAEFTRSATVQNVIVTDDVIDKFDFVNTKEITWGRSLIQGWYDQDHHPFDMSITFVGHTPLSDPVRVQQQMYLDGGAVYGVRATVQSDVHHLNCFSWKQQTLYGLNIRTNEVDRKYSINEIEHQRK